MHSIRNLSSTTSPDALVQLTRFDLIFLDRNFPPYSSLINEYQYISIVAVFLFQEIPFRAARKG